MKIQWSCFIQNRYLLLSISVVDIHDQTATPTFHDHDYTLQCNIIITGLFYIGYTHYWLALSTISHHWWIFMVQLQHSQSMIHNYTLQSNIGASKQSRPYPYTQLLICIIIQYHNISDRYSWAQLSHSVYAWSPRLYWCSLEIHI